jgi:hypothetical protein
MEASSQLESAESRADAAVRMRVEDIIRSSEDHGYITQMIEIHVIQDMPTAESVCDGS